MGSSGKEKGTRKRNTGDGLCTEDSSAGSEESILIPVDWDVWKKKNKTTNNKQWVYERKNYQRGDSLESTLRPNSESVSHSFMSSSFRPHGLFVEFSRQEWSSFKTYGNSNIVKWWLPGAGRMGTREDICQRVQTFH